MSKINLLPPAEISAQLAYVEQLRAIHDEYKKNNGELCLEIY